MPVTAPTRASTPARVMSVSLRRADRGDAGAAEGAALEPLAAGREDNRLKPVVMLPMLLQLQSNNFPMEPELHFRHGWPSQPARFWTGIVAGIGLIRPVLG